MAKHATELICAVRFRVVFKYFGQLCLVLAALTLVPLAGVAIGILLAWTLSGKRIAKGR